MGFIIARAFPRPLTDFEREVMERIGVTMEVAPPRQRNLTEEELLSFARDADAVMTVFEPFTGNVIRQLTKCRLITSIGVGYQNIDVEAATDCGVCVGNNPEYCLEEVSDHAMALLLTLARKIIALDKAVRIGQTGYAELARARGSIPRMRGQTLGLVGFGRIPRTLVPKAQGFGLRVIVHDPYAPPELAAEAGVEMVDLDRLLEESDYVSLHAALTPSNQGMIGVAQLKKMKPTALLVNTARGALVDEEALHGALSEGVIAGAGLDVTEPEPIRPDSPLLALDNVILTGHSAFFSDTAVVEQWKWPITEVARVLTGEWPHALVNPQVKDKFTGRFGSMRG